MFPVRRLGKPLVIHLLMAGLVIVNLFPIYYMVSTSLKTGAAELVNNPFGLPAQPTLAHFEVLPFEKGFVRLFVNSAILTVGSVVLALTFACLAAYALARLRFWGRQVLFDFITSLMAIPVIVVIIPIFVLMSDLKLVNRYPSAIVVYVGFILPFAVFILTAFFRSLPQELLDAARIDGASDLVILGRVVLPLAKAPLATLAIVNGLWVWNDLLIAMMFLQREEMKTLMAGLASFSGRNIRDVPLLMAAAVFVSVPTVLLLAGGQKYFIKGLTSGAVK